MNQQPQITARHVQELMEQAVRLGVNLPQVSLEGFTRCRNLAWSLSRGAVSVRDFIALLGVVRREEAKWAGRVNPVAPFRPQPTQEDGLGNFEIKLPFTVVDSNAPFSLSDSICAGGIALPGGLQSGKSVKAGHIIKAFIEFGKSVIGFDSKGCGEWDFLAISGYPVFLLTVGAEGHEGFYYNPFTDEGGISEVLSQLDILAICTQRKDSQGLLIHAAEHFFASRPSGDQSQLTLAKLFRILTEEVTYATHKHFFQHQLWPSLLNALQSLQSALGATLGVKQGINLEALLRSKASLFVNTSNLTLAQEEYIIASVGWKLYETSRRVYGNSPERQAKVALFIDEASSHLSPKLDQGQRHFGPISELILKARGG